MRLTSVLSLAAAAAVTIGVSTAVQAACSSLPGHDELAKALKTSVKASGGPTNGGLDNHMWATIVDVDGTVCAVAMSGDNFTKQWLGSRAISAQKANTANAFSLDGFALSTGNLFSAVQPGGSLFGLQASNPVDTAVAYGGRADDFGTAADPMIGLRIGGVNVFGGGLALYDQRGKVGAVGVSGDTSCADHNVAWRVRRALALAMVPKGVSPNGDDGIVYDIKAGVSAGGFGHPTCGGHEADVAKEIGSGVVVQ